MKAYAQAYISMYSLETVLLRMGTQKHVAMGGVVSKSIYAIRMALRLSFITKLHFVVQKIPQNLHICNFCCTFAAEYEKMD